MNSELARQAHEILMRATELPHEERARYITEACGGQSALRTRVNGLLSAMERSESFLEKPALSGSTTAEPSLEARTTEPPVEQVGNYCVLRVLGAGGMATVYEAEQDRPRRRVAVKIMRRALIHTAAIARFHYETEVLARLQHPGIAQIFEAGTWQQDGVATPFFAMEFIPDTRHITRYARESNLSREARLELFLRVCDAVQYGHQLGVIHRDLKPGNILVDSRGNPKVIDFGVARSANPDQAWITANQDHHQLVGTLNYMCPEQCERGGAIDTRCDVYALGVVLYELLCQRLPHDLSEVPLPEALRIIREDQPKRPSTFEPGLRGDLDLIVMTAIEKDPNRRYRTVSALAADIRRAMTHLPIEARPPTLTYQAKLFAKRNRPFVIASSLVAAAVVLGATLAFIFALREMRESTRRKAAEAAAIAERDAAMQNAYVATMAAGFGAYQAGELHEVRTQLARAPEPLRGWEWHLLRSFAERSRETRVAHDDMIYDMTLSNDGKRLATACRDGSVRIWSAADGQQLHHFPHTGSVAVAAHCVSFSREGSLLAVGYADGSVCMWDLTVGNLVLKIKHHRQTIQRIAWLTSETIVSASADQKCFVWKAATGEIARELGVDSGGASGVSVSEDGSLLLTWNREGNVRVLNAKSFETLHDLRFEGAVEAATISRDNATFVAGGDRGRLMIWHRARIESPVPHQLRNTSSLVRSLQFSPDSKLLAVGIGDRRIALVPFSAEGDHERLQGHEDTVSAVQFAPDSQTLYSASWDRTIRLWGLTPETRTDFVSQLSAHGAHALAVAFAPDSSVIASGGRDNVIRLFEPDLAADLGVLRGHTGDVAAIAFSPDGSLMASAAYDQTVRVWDTSTWQCRAILKDHKWPVWSVAFSPDGKLLASAGDDAIIRIWDVASGKVLDRLKGHTRRVTQVAFSPDGRHLASASRDHTACIWNVNSGSLMHSMKGHRSDVFAVIFSPDGSRVYSGSRDQSVRVWDVNSGACLSVLDGHGQLITSLAISPDGKRLAGGSWYGQVVLWDLPSHRLMASVRGQLGVVRSVAFSQEGKRLAAASYDGIVFVMDSSEAKERMARTAAASKHRTAAEALLSELDGRSPASTDLLMKVETRTDLTPEVRKWVRLLHLQRTLDHPPAPATQPGEPEPEPSMN